MIAMSNFNTPTHNLDLLTYHLVGYVNDHNLARFAPTTARSVIVGPRDPNHAVATLVLMDDDFQVETHVFIVAWTVFTDADPCRPALVTSYTVTDYA